MSIEDLTFGTVVVVVGQTLRAAGLGQIIGCFGWQLFDPTVLKINRTKGCGLHCCLVWSSNTKGSRWRNWQWQVCWCCCKYCQWREFHPRYRCSWKWQCLSKLSLCVTITEHNLVAHADCKSERSLRLFELGECDNWDVLVRRRNSWLSVTSSRLFSQSFVDPIMSPQFDDWVGDSDENSWRLWYELHGTSNPVRHPNRALKNMWTTDDYVTEIRCIHTTECDDVTDDVAKRHASRLCPTGTFQNTIVPGTPVLQCPYSVLQYPPSLPSCLCTVYCKKNTMSIVESRFLAFSPKSHRSSIPHSQTNSSLNSIKSNTGFCRTVLRQ